MRLSRKEALGLCFTAIILHWYEFWSTNYNSKWKAISHEGQEKISYVLLAVSGTLEEGFELRENLDYRPQESTNVGRVNATFLGKALVRGYKSFLDIKNPSWREYKTEGFKTVNPAIVPTGCDEHANRYSIYAVDSRQAILALAGEPRFLSIAPDMGLTDLTAADDLTFPAIKQLVAAFSKLTGDERSPTKVAFLTVTSTWLKSTFVPNGVIRRDENGIITDFPESTAIWSTSVLNKKGLHARFPEGCGSNPSGGRVRNVDSVEDYSECIDAAIRLQESEYTVKNGEQVGELTEFQICAETATKACFPCRSQARYGVDKDTLRFNKVLEACELEELVAQAGITGNHNEKRRFRLQGCSLTSFNGES